MRVWVSWVLVNPRDSDVVATLLRKITPDPDRSPIWIRIVATTSADELFDLIYGFKGEMVGWTIPSCVLFCARVRLKIKKIGERVEKSMIMV
jgi:hypothetical protein